MIATSCFLAALECTKFVFGRGSARDPTGGALALPRPSSWFNGPYRPTSDGRGGKVEGKGEGRESRDRPPFANYWIRPWSECLHGVTMA